MNSFSVKLRFTTNFLAGGDRKGGIRRLETDAQHRILLPMEHISKVTDRFPSIKLEPYLRNAPCSLLTRVYNRARVDKFEGIARGGKANWMGVIEPGKEDKLNECMSLLGRSGISQWGIKFNCGRFDVLAIEI